MMAENPKWECKGSVMDSPRLSRGVRDDKGERTINERVASDNDLSANQ